MRAEKRISNTEYRSIIAVHRLLLHHSAFDIRHSIVQKYLNTSDLIFEDALSGNSTEEVLKEGKGENPIATSKLKIHYHGTLIDGTVFDSSVDKKQPYDSNANQFIKGFTEGLLLMNKGAKYKLFIPQELAYGATPRPGKIKPFAAIVFEVELLDIIKK